MSQLLGSGSTHDRANGRLSLSQAFDLCNYIQWNVCLDARTLWCGDTAWAFATHEYKDLTGVHTWEWVPCIHVTKPNNWVLNWDRA